MKKFLALILTLCLMMTTMSAFAENVEVGESGMDLSGLMSMFGGSESVTGSSSFDLSTLLGSLGFTAATPVTTVAAKSEDQFYGTWKLSRFIAKGYEASMDLFEKFGLKTSIEMTVAADKLTFAADGKTTEIEVTESKLADGELTIIMKGETLKLALSETGELVLTAPSMESTAFAVFFTK